MSDKTEVDGNFDSNELFFVVNKVFAWFFIATSLCFTLFSIVSNGADENSFRMLVISSLTILSVFTASKLSLMFSNESWRIIKVTDAILVVQIILFIITICSYWCSLLSRLMANNFGEAYISNPPQFIMFAVTCLLYFLFTRTVYVRD